MPDITMCSSEVCMSRHRCYRSIAKPSATQFYDDFLLSDGRCQKFIEAISKSQVKRLDAMTNKEPPKC